MKSILKYKISFAFAVSFGMLILISVISYRSVNSLVDKSNWVNHTNTVLNKLENILALTNNAEAAQRGYLLSSEESFLNSYNKGYPEIENRLREIAILTIDNEIQQLYIDTLKIYLNEKIRIIDHTIKLQKAGKSIEALMVIRSKEGKRVMDNITLLIGKMKTVELSLLKERSEHVKFLSKITPSLLVFFFLLSISIIGVSYYFIFRDFTRRVYSENLLSGVFNSSISGIIAFESVKDKSGKIVDFKASKINKQGENMFGSKTDIVNQFITKLFPDVMTNGLIEKLKTLAESGEAVNLEVYSEILQKWLHTVAVKIENGIAVTFTDITEKKYSENRIKEDRFLLSGVLNSSTTGIMGLKAVRENNKIVDFEWKLINAGAEKLVGRSDLVGKRLLQQMPGNKDTGLFDGYVGVVEKEETIDIEQYYEPDGFKTWFRIVAVKWQDGFVVNFEDITQRKQIEEKLMAQNEELIINKEKLKAYNEELERRVEKRTLELMNKNDELILINKDLDNFIYAASHDLKSPISNIEGLINVLEEESNLKEHASVIQMINRSIEKFKNTINDLTDTAKLQSDFAKTRTGKF